MLVDCCHLHRKTTCLQEGYSYNIMNTIYSSMHLPAIVYVFVNLLLFSFGGIVYTMIIFNKACSLGLKPPTPFSLTQPASFWIFIKNKSKHSGYKSLRKYIVILRYFGIINFLIGSIFLVIYWELIQSIVSKYLSERVFPMLGLE